MSHIAVNKSPSRFVLVDFDNLRKAQGLSVAETVQSYGHIFNKLEKSSDFFDGVTQLEHVTVLFFGGWFCGDHVTPEAQEVFVEIGRRCGETIKLNNGTAIKVDGKRCSGLSFMHGKSLYNTFRRCRVRPRVNKKFNACCDKQREAIEQIRDYLQGESCVYCKKNPSDELFEIDAQKMVDSLIFCTAMELSEDATNSVAIVSSDSDMIPVVFSLASKGRRIYHVFTSSTEDNSYRDFYALLCPKDCRKVFW